MANSFLSFDSCLSDSDSENDKNEDSKIQGNCSICKVRLNIVGIQHTRSARCNKCKNILCVNCVSDRETYKRQKQCICKTCGHKDLLIDNDTLEIEERYAEVELLKDKIRQAGTQKNLLAIHNKELQLEIDDVLNNPERFIRKETLRSLRHNHISLKTERDEISHSLSSLSHQISKSWQDFDSKNKWIESLSNSYHPKSEEEATLKHEILIHRLNSLKIQKIVKQISLKSTPNPDSEYQECTKLASSHEELTEDLKTLIIKEQEKTIKLQSLCDLHKEKIKSQSLAANKLQLIYSNFLSTRQRSSIDSFLLNRKSRSESMSLKKCSSCMIF
ncbi:hypothetical protein SteCoe_31002 [Stentor coeruleus]|uniref:Uncharacterized protein n=1 Tax=Stentor coeruleus TaxID=5963 RepID=A0A1R2B2K5_9CILI|nr:hypothetical protein SteCoe_31002 [Stentor coeruleus]